MTSEFRDALFQVIRCGMEIESTAMQISAQTCKKLLRFGTRQSIQPIIYHGLKRLSAPEASLREFDQIRLTDTYNAIQHGEALKRICAALDEEGIQHILLKGAALRELYPRPDMRTSCDIDILVHEEELEKAVQTIEARTEFKLHKRTYHDISMLSPRVHLELHFNIREHEENMDQLLGRAWEFSGPAGEGSRYVFTPEYQIFHVVAHMCHHFLHGGIGIRPFMDLWLLRNQTEFEEKTVRRMCEECGILKFYAECCGLSQVWLERAEHTQTTALLEEFCLSGGVFGSQKFKNAARQRERRGVKYVLSRVFPPEKQVKDYYKDPTGQEHILAYYYIKRLVSWSGKDRRKELQAQLHQVLSGDQAYLDAADDLFRRLGLLNYDLEKGT